MSDGITVQGVVHDSRIEVPAPAGYAEGQLVSVTIQPVQSPDSRRPLNSSIANAFGILSQEEGADLDQFLAESRRWQLVERRDQEL